MNRTEYLLTCLGEECAEIAQRVAKALRFGLDEVQPGQKFSNAERITAELEDLIGVMEILTKEEGVIPPTRSNEECYRIKLAKINYYMAISRVEGALTE